MNRFSASVVGLPLLLVMSGGLDARAGDSSGGANSIYKEAAKVSVLKTLHGCSTQFPTKLAASCANAYEPKISANETFFPWVASETTRNPPKFSVSKLGNPLTDTGAMAISAADSRDLYHRVTQDNCPAIQIIDFNAGAGLAQVQCVCATAGGECDTSKVLAKPMWINLDNLQCEAKNVATYARFRGGSCPGRTDGSAETTGVKSAGKSTEEMANAAGRKFVERALQKMGEVQLNAEYDQLAITETFKDTAPGDFYHRMVTSEKRLSGLEARATDPKYYGPDCAGTPDPKFKLNVDQVIQGRRTCLLLQESRRFVKAQLEKVGWKPDEDPAAVDAEEDPETGLSRNPLSFDRGKKLMARILNADNISEEGGVTYDQLVLKMTMFYGMTDAQQAGLVGKTSAAVRAQKSKSAAAKGEPQPGPDNKIAYARYSKEMGNPPFLELHNGYVFVRDGGDAALSNQVQGEDCSTLAGMTVLGDGKGKVAPSTYDLNEITNFIRRGRVGEPAGRWKFLANCFDEVDLRAGQVPRPGDLVYERDDVSKDNHVVIVQEYNTKSGEIDTVELAGGKKSTVKNLRRSLYETACGHQEGTEDWNVRPVKSDLRVLRFAQHPGCPLKPEKL